MTNHNLELIADIDVLDSEGNVLDAATVSKNGLQSDGINVNGRTIPFKSFTYNWTKLLYCLANNTTQTFNATDGSTVTTNPMYLNLDSAGSEETDYGIIVGLDNGTTLSKAPNNYNLGDQIDHGFGADELLYSSSSESSAAVSGLIYRTTVSRDFVNWTGATVTIQEMGIVGSGIGSDYILYARDLTDYDGSAISLDVWDAKKVSVEYSFYVNTDSGFTTNFVKAVESVIKTDNTIDLTDTTGANVTVGTLAELYKYFYCNASASEDSYGIVIGSDTSAEDINDYALGTQIADGIGSGELSHELTTFTTPSTSGSNSSFRINRSFTNDGMFSVAVNEIGLYSFGDGASDRVMLARIKLNSTATIPATGILNVRLTIRNTT